MRPCRSKCSNLAATDAAHRAAHRARSLCATTAHLSCVPCLAGQFLWLGRLGRLLGRRGRLRRVGAQGTSGNVMNAPERYQVSGVSSGCGAGGAQHLQEGESDMSSGLSKAWRQVWHLLLGGRGRRPMQGARMPHRAEPQPSNTYAHAAGNLRRVPSTMVPDKACTSSMIHISMHAASMHAAS